jgi:hypothetical protein
MLLLMTLLSLQDTTAFTRLSLVVDSAVYADIRMSEFLPQAFGSVDTTSSEAIVFCERLTCLSFSPPDATSNRRVGDVTIGVRPSAQRKIPVFSADSTRNRIMLVTSDPPPAPDYRTPNDSLPLVYHLTSAELALPAEAIVPLAAAFRQLGVEVIREGTGLVVNFPNQVVRIGPAWDSSTPRTLRFLLRRPMPGNPTYQFAGRVRLQFAERTAVWTF